jgi:hypothetical protein
MSPALLQADCISSTTLLRCLFRNVQEVLWKGFENHSEDSMDLDFPLVAALEQLLEQRRNDLGFEQLFDQLFDQI